MKNRILLFFVSALVVSLTNFCYAQKGPEEIVNQFFDSYKVSPSGAVDELLNSNTWMAENQGALNQVKTQLNNAVQLIGDYKGFEKISEVKKGESLVQLIYFVRYDRQPLRFVFLFYKPDDQWRIQNFLFDEKFLED
ncbi:hypothetical protein J0A68_09855 [Algoriphagus sp. H41]|uniref:DUF4878 domain-containing protein n=1 Tax=Algoriphagus oliviformis TaxID=2811231 RepID=A0ABS3C2U0_9BACT|nr:hypothetical protein [Algoriphagus oliviformis]MBN7811262.1 hypothetical protein [Algoriphagus oliviformis]